MEENRFDAIVIGSGIGGLTTAALLSRVGKKKVLVLEQHWEVGGLTHEFKRKGKYHWDVGIHYIGKMPDDSLPMKVLRFISGNQLIWNQMPHEFDHLHFPDLKFSIPSDEVEFKKKLIDMFPEEKAGILKYFKDLKKANKWYLFNLVGKMLPSPLAFFLNLWNQMYENLALTTTGDYLNANLHDQKLKAILTGQWGDYGLTPESSSFLIHSIIATHYLQGAVFPDGGAGKIAESIEPAITENGGKIILSAEVTDLILENGKLQGVEAQHKRGEKKKEKYFAPIVISSTGAKHTYGKLLKDSVSQSYFRELESLKSGKSAVTLYLGLKENPEKLGFKGENHWIYKSFNHDESITEQEEKLLKGKPTSCFLSFPSLKNTQASGHTAEIISFANFQLFQNWEETKWKKRGEEYDNLKEIISEGLLNLVEETFPGFRDLVDYKELSTPLTYKDLAGRSDGEFYNLAATPERFRIKILDTKTPLDNFYLTGTDVSSLGFVGALMGGVLTTSRILNPSGFLKIMKHLSK
ncbi:MAG: NAD(P)/FAD-dependent oxidoreductase [Leptospiraceae bacterium]|nr:NAD(P)/FAD-dependent oxidoreductase [Leptospiraceae bacterium]MCP5513413.1 NAD(P)/FAD-dependent oxidoreductase [Leptospiraceae bacterium]